MTDHVETLREFGERRIIAELVAPLLSTKNGNLLLDDCAVVNVGGPQLLLLSVDQGPQTSFLELLGIGSPADVAHFLVTANVSDIAAMGGTPLGILLVIARPPSDTVASLNCYLEGISVALTEYRLELLGGDTKQATVSNSSITVLGWANPNGAIARRGATPGEVIYIVTPPLGSILGAYIRTARERDESRRKVVPRPRAQIEVGQKLAQSRIATSCMDMSDGLLASVLQLAEANKTTFEIDLHCVPLAQSPKPELEDRWRELVFNVGGDFGLIFTASHARAEEAERLGAIPIGHVRGGTTGDVRLRNATVALRPWEQYATVERISDVILSFL
jgi:thiamine-monophosphate kinase